MATAAPTRRPKRAETSHLDAYAGVRLRWLRRLRMARARARARRSGLFHLTFDDGPEPLRTPAILDALAAEEAAATFFVMAERAVASPDLIAEIRARGHALELHCLDHVPHAYAGRAATEHDTAEALEVLAEVGVRPSLWRPPYGDVQPWSAEVARGFGLSLCGWSVDPEDWRGDGVTAMLERSVNRIEPGAIVLCHDGAGPGASPTGTFDTPRLVQELCEIGRERGLRPATVHEGTALGLLFAAPHGASGRAAELGVRPIDEGEIPPADLAAVRALLAGVITRHAEEYAERGYRRLRPEYRVLVYGDSAVVGTCSVFRIGAEPALRVYGIGDLVVSPEARGGGLARRMLRIAFSEARRRDADVVIGDTTAVATTLATLGFEHVPRFRFYHERDDACSWAPNWWAWEREPIPAPRLLLEEGDF